MLNTPYYQDEACIYKILSLFKTGTMPKFCRHPKSISFNCIYKYPSFQITAFYKLVVCFLSIVSNPVV